MRKAQASTRTSPTLRTYRTFTGYPLPSVGGANNVGGDLNSTYSQMFYSISHATASGCGFKLSSWAPSPTPATSP